MPMIEMNIIIQIVFRYQNHIFDVLTTQYHLIYLKTVKTIEDGIIRINDQSIPHHGIFVLVNQGLCSLILSYFQVLFYPHEHIKHAMIRNTHFIPYMLHHR